MGEMVQALDGKGNAVPGYDAFALPRSYWERMGVEELESILKRNGWLNRPQRRLLWQVADLDGPVAPVVYLVFSVARMEVAFPLGEAGVQGSSMDVSEMATALHQVLLSQHN